MKYKYDATITSSEITPKDVYLNRRRFIKRGVAAIGASMVLPVIFNTDSVSAGEKIANYTKSEFVVDEALTSYKDVTSYINFYEFGFDKRSPVSMAKDFQTQPWSVTITGEVKKPGVYHLEDILKPHPLEERIYRLRCVEAWSMVIPWIGFPLADLIKRFEPTSKAKYVALSTLYDPEQMPNQKRESFSWPYQEGLRMDEAMHPLTLIVVGLYGEILPNQNGAPLRLVVPWKYGFKSLKSIAKIEFSETQPETTWGKYAPHEYGFYANVNPRVDHPRWSQATERRVGESGKRDTLLFNGYADQVASLYAGMDLDTYF